MQIKIQATDFKLTPAVEEYARKRMGALEKFISKENNVALAEVEVGRVSHRHRQGEVYRAEVNISTPGHQWRAEAEEEDIYSAIDAAKEGMEREITSFKDKERTLMKRGSIVVKDIIKGFGKFKWKRFPKLPRFPRWKK